ncbi:MAG: flagellar biosynthesis regulator FlaF [Alphaproteobacteria bacterium]|nr:flagellar biosynthesis regulator FlaF [Alphaproteobacteria bacterium]
MARTHDAPGPLFLCRQEGVLHNLAYKAYGQIQQRTGSDKGIEHALFVQITDALEDVARSESPTPAAKADAIYRNQQLWTLLATDLMSPANALPDDLKARLLQLSKFVQKTSMQILSGEGDIADLVEVNKPIIAGLAGSDKPELQGEAA